MKQIGNTIKELRLKKGMTQKQLAAAVKVSSAKICAIEKALTPITAATILKLSAALKVSPGKFLFEEWDEYTPAKTAWKIRELNEELKELDQKIYSLRLKIIELYEQLHQVPKI
ncbi:helix-turn-helix domain-containing protein [Pedobacter sp. L105]|uniref:helix-turn-helix domain-containing protein n=1 Tax=Pedobacter sp. L105 TaxID=1641871 RepID=UPI00131C6614|nr:helix-turn-helix transcriptional regulator [Pedobacter sp. L105]